MVIATKTLVTIMFAAIYIIPMPLGHYSSTEKFWEMGKKYMQCLHFIQFLKRITTTNHFYSIHYMPAESGQMCDGWLSVNGLVCNRKNTLVKEGRTSVDLGVSPHLWMQGRSSGGFLRHGAGSTSCVLIPRSCRERLKYPLYHYSVITKPRMLTSKWATE